MDTSYNAKHRTLGIIAVCGLLAFVLTACSDAAATTPNSTPMPNTPVATARYGSGGYSADLLANPTIAAGATEVRREYEARQTALALTPTIPVATRAPWTPEPTATYGVGMITDLHCWNGMPAGLPVFDSCWHTSVGSSWVLIGAGYGGFSEDDARRGIVPEADWHGLLWVCTEPCGAPRNENLYPAPRPDLHITAVNGAVVTLAARDPAVTDTFLFDVTTHQWQPPLPTPTLTP